MMHLPHHHPASKSPQSVSTTSTTRNRRSLRTSSPSSSDQVLSKVLLIFALLWPLVPILLSSTNSSPSGKDATLSFFVNSSYRIRSRFRTLLDQYNILGYGPRHPRVAFILVSSSLSTTDRNDSSGSHVAMQNMIESIQSIFENTDRNRLFQIYAVFEPNTLSLEAQKQELTETLDAIDRGATTIHWHGLTQHSPHSDHLSLKDRNETNSKLHHYGQKIQLLFPNQSGVAENRREAAKLLETMIQQHERMDLKSKDEEIILVFMKPGVLFRDREWIDAVTGALIVPMEEEEDNTDAKTKQEEALIQSSAQQLQQHQQRYAKMIANAVAFKVSSSTNPVGVHGVNFGLEPVVLSANTQSLSSEEDRTTLLSYPTPVVEGSITALRLNTFLQLPAKDPDLQSDFAADLELSWNLWLCADGIDVVTAARVVTTAASTATSTAISPKTLPIQDAARIATSWIPPNSVYSRFFLQSRGLREKNDLMTMALSSKTLPTNLDKKCRPFQWYVSDINSLAMNDKDVNILEKHNAPKKNMAVSERDQIPPAKISNHNKKIIVDPNQIKSPLTPLRLENKQIVSRTHPIDLAFVDVTNGFKNDPHRGAKDEHGNFGYVHDETALRNSPPQYMVPDKTLACKKDGHFKMLTKKVLIDMDAHKEHEKAAKAEGKDRVKVFCVVYTIEKNHERLPAIRETWGPKCDGFMIASDVTDKALGTVNIPHEGPEEYNNIWQKIRSIWSYIYDNYYEKYDFFHIGGDDLYILVENLRLYLESDEIRLAANGGNSLPTGSETTAYPLFLGRRFAEQGDMKRIFNSGGAGYTLNKAALKALVVDAFPVCMPHFRTFAEDVMVAQCLREHIHVFPYDTKDENGGERYMPFTPAHHLTYRLPDDKENSEDWYVKYSINIKEGLDHCSAQSVAFHYIETDLMRRMHAILYGYCDTM